MEEAFQTLNLAFCELTSLLMLEGTSHVHSSRQRIEDIQSSGKRTSASDALNSLHVDRVREYALSVLRGEFSVTDGAQPAIFRSISYSAYIALLPTIWALLSSNGRGQPGMHEELLNALVDHSMKVSSNSAPKRHTIAFLGRIALVC